ncbi:MULTISPECIES: DUF1295 domain-containing protein [unclassified Arthrobacter]|uniref:DUF1295 domain-containing protein n=1 Tax=unclassified Arthrobacter TaxID=235627 RepID=UPI001E4F0068|nr:MULTISPECIES: DUF1295 domain-containing protein [unclassified Arthrobacter]MCC9144393.1 DUF1295 domain-containing protein [Arthrobacter sp. zg-Y919]MDK1275619.1 DUF1295 domain-containing protein [Arthrobacter sp. zg.Y919]WIB03012.1 DUF1295 domain-containing protein [Arthrobacter sp. zg-Y919]
MDPVRVCLEIFAGTCAGTWLLSLLTREYSWTDRIWSVVPLAYLWVFAAASDGDPRVTLMAVLVTLWGARLTFNFARKGGYAPGGEDYRWGILRRRLKPWQFQVFNLLFISIYQNIVIWVMTLPVLTVYRHPGPLTGWDWLLATLFVLALAGETLADQQQWNFQQWKKTLRTAGRSPATGFLQTGLFRYSRHPNFFFEQAQWWLFYGFAVAATGAVLHWTLAGPILVTLLFAGSTVFTESISLTRYPDYADYRRRTSRIIPLPPRLRPQHAG